MVESLHPKRLGVACRKDFSFVFAKIGSAEILAHEIFGLYKITVYNIDSYRSVQRMHQTVKMRRHIASGSSCSEEKDFDRTAQTEVHNAFPFLLAVNEGATEAVQYSGNSAGLTSTTSFSGISINFPPLEIRARISGDGLCKRPTTM